MQNSQSKFAHKLLAGKIGAPHGVRGWVKVFPYTESAENLLNYQPWWVQRQGVWQCLKVLHAQIHGTALIVSFEGIVDRDQAQRLTNTEICIDREALPKLAKGEYYWSQLEGLQVKNLEGFEFGSVRHLMSTGANDVMFIKGKKEYCLPYVPGQVVKEVDLAKQEILVDWPEEI